MTEQSNGRKIKSKSITNYLTRLDKKKKDEQNCAKVYSFKPDVNQIFNLASQTNHSKFV